MTDEKIHGKKKPKVEDDNIQAAIRQQKLMDTDARQGPQVRVCAQEETDTIMMPETNNMSFGSSIT